MTDDAGSDMVTVLDTAHAAMEAAPEDETARLRFFERLSDAELFLLLEEEATGDQIKPRVFPLDDPVVLVFDREERLAQFAGAAPYAAMSGRVVADLLAGQGMALGVNLDVAPSAIILPPAALTWLAEMLAQRPEEAEDVPEEISPPGALPEAVLLALDTKMASAGGLAAHAYLCAVRYASGQQTHLLAFIDPLPGAEPALARAAGEALSFSGIEAGQIDVAFFPAHHDVAPQLARQGLRFDLPKAEPVAQTPVAPGMDPDKPPRLR